jgi:hypothetical protein
MVNGQEWPSELAQHRGGTMNPSMTQSLAFDHIRESRQQAAAARRAGGEHAAGRGPLLRLAGHAARRGHRQAREV